MVPVSFSRTMEIEVISHAYTGCGHAGFRFDVDDAHDAFIGDDFPY